MTEEPGPKENTNTISISVNLMQRIRKIAISFLPQNLFHQFVIRAFN